MSTFQMFRGDTEKFTIPVRRAGIVEALTGATLWFTAKSSLAAEDADAEIQHSTLDGGIVVTDAVGGLATLTISPADTDAFQQDTKLYYDVQLKTALGAIETIDSGTLMVKRDVTRVT